MELAVLALAGSGTALATASAPSRSPISACERRPAAGALGLTVGLMTVASVVGLLLPAPTRVLGGVAAGAARAGGLPARLAPAAGGARRPRRAARGAGVRRSVLVFAVLLVHSLPEGFAIGTAFASDRRGSASS